jgi:hypothetical protein
VSDTDQRDVAHHAFTAMAQRAEAIKAGEFGGAFVFVPPEGEAVSMMLVNPDPDMAAFLGALSGRVQQWLGEIEERSKGANQWGRR